MIKAYWDNVLNILPTCSLSHLLLMTILDNWSHNGHRAHSSRDKARYQTNQHRQGTWNWLHPNGIFTFLWGLLFQLSSTWLLWSGEALLYFRTGFMEFRFQYLYLYVIGTKVSPSRNDLVRCLRWGWGSCWISNICFLIIPEAPRGKG